MGSDEEEVEAPEGDFMAKLGQKVGSDLTAIRSTFDRQASEGNSELSTGGRGSGSRGRGNNRRDSGVPVRIIFSFYRNLTNIYTFPLHR